MDYKCTSIIPQVMSFHVSESNPQRYEIQFINYAKVIEKRHVNTIEDALELKHMWMNDIPLPIIEGNENAS
tara:strand:- start:612 stop:824 length:213 start_codon:yes stop_codon:yes gene_type:complete